MQVLSIDFEVDTAKTALAACTRGDEMDIYSTKLIMMAVRNVPDALYHSVEACLGTISRTKCFLVSIPPFCTTDHAKTVL